MPHVVGILLALSLPSFAGGEFSEEELQRYHRQCHQESKGDACLVLAGETMCGRGFNEETQALMNKACTGYQKRCAKKEADSCQGYHLRCLLPCLSVEFDIEAFTDLHHGSGDCTSLHPRASTEKRQEKIRASMYTYLETSCSPQYPKNCDLLGELYAQTDISKSETYWARACEYNSPESCMKWGAYLREKGKAMEKKGCALAQEQNKQFRYPYKYKNICAEHKK